MAAVQGERWQVNLLRQERQQRFAMPPGMTSGSAQQSSEPVRNVRREVELRTKRLWEAARSPVQAIFMNGLMLWMVGSGVGIFSIMMTYMTMSTALRSMFGSGQVFQQFADLPRQQVLMARAIYVALYLAMAGLGIYKLASMGLLPTHASDWLAGRPAPTPYEFAVGGSAAFYS